MLFMSINAESILETRTASLRQKLRPAFLFIYLMWPSLEEVEVNSSLEFSFLEEEVLISLWDHAGSLSGSFDHYIIHIFSSFDKHLMQLIKIIIQNMLIFF